jgi:membrane dipeptidase
MSYLGLWSPIGQRMGYLRNGVGHWISVCEIFFLGGAALISGMAFPILDLHCDLLSYLEVAPGSTVHDADAIGCALPHLRAGGVRVQVMALFALTEAGSTGSGQRQVDFYRAITAPGMGFRHLTPEVGLLEVLEAGDVFTLPAIENASCFCEEDEPLADGLARLETFIAAMGKPLYLTITHHAENRFGGGNLTDVGLKPDGEALLRYLSGRRIAIDFSHTCDRFARELLAFIDAEGLDLPVLASHSNFRPVWDHARNLPDWLTAELTQRGGVIGLNFVRDFVHPEAPAQLYAHVAHGQAQGARIAWGADYFSPLIMPPQFAFRLPYFHPEHADARCYPVLMEALTAQGREGLLRLAFGDAWVWLQGLR